MPLPLSSCEVQKLSDAIDLKAALAPYVVEASPDGKIVIDRSGKIILVNQRAEFLFWYGRSEMEKMTIEALLPEDIRERHVEFRRKFFDDPRTREMGQGRVLNGARSDGTSFRVQISLAPIIIPSRGIFALAVVRPVEETPNA